MTGLTEDTGGSRRWETQNMSRHPQYHRRMCCEETDHPGIPKNRKVNFSLKDVWISTLAIPEEFHHQSLSPNDLLKLMEKSEERTTGGALFTRREKWEQWFGQKDSKYTLYPSLRFVRQGGVDWKTHPVHQQAYRLPKSMSTEEMELTQARFVDLYNESAYELVTDTIEEEEKIRWAAVATVTATPRTSSLGSQSKHGKREWSPETQNHQLQLQRRNQGKTKARSPTSTSRVTTQKSQIFYSDLYTILKGDKVSRRLLQDMKASGANKSVWKKKHKQDGLETLQGMIRPGDRFYLIDLRDCFHQFRVHPSMRRMLRAHLRMKYHDDLPADLKKTLLKMASKGTWVVVRVQSTTLSQGFCEAPGIATLVLGDVLKLLRSLGLRCRIKIDDLVGVAPNDISQAMAESWLAGWVLTSLGGVVKAKKGLYDLPHRVQWCGKVVCSIVQVTSDPGEKIVTKIALLKGLVSLLTSRDGLITVRLMARTCGVMLASLDCIASMRVRTMELCWLRLLLQKDPNWTWDRVVNVSDLPPAVVKSVIKECQGWQVGYDPLHPHLHPYNGCFHMNDPPQARIYTDACNFQKGTFVEADPANGHPAIYLARPFVGADIHKHITIQETLAAVEGILFTMRTRDYRDCVLTSMIDATAAVKYVRTLGGKKREFTAAIIPLYEELRLRKIQLECFHVPGHLNPADEPSRDKRRFTGKHEAQLRKKIALSLFREMGFPCLDLMASESNSQHTRYVSMDLADTSAIAYNAMVFPLQQETGIIYCFPPPIKQVISKVVAKLVAARVDAIVIVPAWSMESLHLLLQHTVQMPMLMECTESLFERVEAYVAHGESQSRWWIQRAFRALVGVRIASSRNASAEFRRSLLAAWTLASNLTKVEYVAHTVMQHGRSLRPLSEKCGPQATLISRMMLSCATQY